MVTGLKRRITNGQFKKLFIDNPNWGGEVKGVDLSLVSEESLDRVKSLENCYFSPLKRNADYLFPKAERVANCVFRNCDIRFSEKCRTITSTFMGCQMQFWSRQRMTKCTLIECGVVGFARINNSVLVDTEANLSSSSHGNITHAPSHIPDGDIEVWKKVKTSKPEYFLVKMIIPSHALRRCEVAVPKKSWIGKCRASEAKVVAFYKYKGRGKSLKLELSDTKQVTHIPYNSTGEKTIYRVGRTVKPSQFESHPNAECAPGIHFFLAKEEAASW